MLTKYLAIMQRISRAHIYAMTEPYNTVPTSASLMGKTYKLN